MPRNDYLLYTAVWLALVLLTLSAWVIGHRAPVTVDGPPLAIAGGILGLAFVKVALVMAVFMDLRRAPWGLIAIAAIWMIVECSVLLALVAR